MTKEQIIHEISSASKPGKMTTNEALRFWQEIIDVLKEMIDCMKDEYILEGDDV